MPRYLKKPVEVEARLIDRDESTFHDIVAWCGGVAVHPDATAYMDGNKVLYIDTLEGRMFADMGDYIIRGVKGEFYPCKPDIFDATYEPVEA